MTSHDHDLTSRDLFGPWKLKNWKSIEYRHVAYQMKAKEIFLLLYLWITGKEEELFRVVGTTNKKKKKEKLKEETCSPSR